MLPEPVATWKALLCPVWPTAKVGRPEKRSRRCRQSKAVARDWGYEQVYLHAATRQQRLLDMYAKLDYTALPSFDQPDWVLAVSGREETRYHVKELAPKPAEVGAS